MLTLSAITKNVADQLSRYDLDEQIGKEIGLAIRRYSREITYLTEVRAGSLILVPGQMWYDNFNVASGTGPQDTRNRVAVPFTNVTAIHAVRHVSREALQPLLLEQGLGPLNLEGDGFLLLNDYIGANWNTYPLIGEVHYMDMERADTFPFPGAVCGYSMYAGQMGVWPSRPDEGAEALYISASVKPLVPDLPDDTSVFFDEAQELIEAAAAKGICAKYLMDAERAAIFGGLETVAFNDLTRESNRKASTGRIRARW